MNKFTHIGEKNQAKMVHVGDKEASKRSATARAVLFLGSELIALLSNDEIVTKKGPVFQTAIIAGIQAVKKTSNLIPMCHPLQIEGIDFDIDAIDAAHIQILCTVEIHGKTGVEMEALTGVSVAGLTIYDMCKSYGQNMTIKEVKLLKKTGGKSDYLISKK